MLCILVSYPMKFYSLVYLSENGLVFHAVARMESGIIAKSTTAPSLGSVPVGAGKPGIYD